MMTLAEDEHALVKNDLLHVRLSGAGTHVVNTLPNIQAQGLHIPRRGATAHCHDGTRQRLAGGPVLSSDGCSCRMVLGAG
jgi:hypothetical protein